MRSKKLLEKISYFRAKGWRYNVLISFFLLVNENDITENTILFYYTGTFVFKYLNIKGTVMCFALYTTFNILNNDVTRLAQCYRRCYPNFMHEEAMATHNKNIPNLLISPYN